MNSLNIHFGFQTAEDTRSTAIGWGLIAEAFANFGYPGVLGMGIVIGIIAGFFMRLSSGAAPTSTGTFLGIVGLMTLINMEADFSNLITNLFQACVSILLLLAALDWLALRERGTVGRHRPCPRPSSQLPALRNSA
jgi:hypothetical protein